MNQQQEKDIIRTLMQAGHEALAKTYARSRGYRIVGYKPQDELVVQLVARIKKMKSAIKRLNLDESRDATMLRRGLINKATDMIQNQHELQKLKRLNEAKISILVDKALKQSGYNLA